MCSKKFWEELIIYFPLIRHGPHRERKTYGMMYRQADKGVLISPLSFFENEAGYTETAR
jgi:hypothetical protein